MTFDVKKYPGYTEMLFRHRKSTLTRKKALATFLTSDEKEIQLYDFYNKYYFFMKFDGFDPMVNIYDDLLFRAGQLLLLTAARKNEILTCKWEWVDFDNSLINLPDSKTGQKTIFLNSKALKILNQLYARPERELSEYIIKGKNFKGHNVDFKTAWHTIMKNANIKNFRVHDLRHTAASMAISHGHSEAAIAKMLGHKSTAMIKHYAHLANKPVFDVADTLSELINF